MKHKKQDKDERTRREGGKMKKIKKEKDWKKTRKEIMTKISDIGFIMMTPLYMLSDVISWLEERTEEEKGRWTKKDTILSIISAIASIITSVLVVRSCTG